MQLNLNNMYKFLEITDNGKPFHAMACLFLILFYAATVYPQPSKAVDKKNLRNPPLLFLGNKTLPPMIYMKDDKAVGIIVDIAEALKTRMNHRVRLDYMNWSQAQQLVLEGKADALLQINSSEERKKIYDFSDTLLESEFSIFTSSDRKDVFDSAGLRGLQVGVEEKGLPIQILKQDPLIKIVVIPDITSGFHLLADGGVDAVVVDRWVGLFVIAENNLRKIKITGEAIDKSSSAIAVKKGNTKLLADINKALAEIKDDGTYTEILSKWESKEIVYQTKDQYFKQKIILTATLCVLLIMIIAGIFLLIEIKKRSRSEKLLREREEKYEHLFNNAEVGMCRARLDGSEVLEINHRLLDIVGMTLEETLGKPSINFWADPKDREEMVKRLVADGSVSAFEHKILNKRQNEVRNCLTSIRLYRDQGILEGSILDITDRKRTEEALQQAHDELEHRVVMRTKELMQVNEILRSEITERRQAEEAFRQSETKLGDATRIAHVGYWDRDYIAESITLSDEACRIFGLPMQNRLPKLTEWHSLWLKLIHPDDQPKVARALTEALAGGPPYNVDYRVVRSDGEVRSIHSYAEVKRDGSGRPIRMFGTMIDITERKQAERHAALMSFALNNVHEAVYLTDENARFHYVNEESCRILGYTRDELLGLSVPDIDADFPAKRWADHWNKLKTKHSLTFETHHKAKDGRIVQGEINTNYFEYEGQEYNLALVRNIDDRKQAEKERMDHLRFFESMDQFNRVILGTNDLEQMMDDALNTVFSIFDCDRVSLVYPCDPMATSWRVPMECTRPEYPGVHSLGIDIPTDPEVARSFQILIASDGPVKFGPGSEHPLPFEVAQRFGFQSFIGMALHPKVGKPWELVLHQCSYPRIWTTEEEQLFQGIAQRLTDALTSLLSYRHLQESEAKYRRIVDTADEGIWMFGEDLITTFVNTRMAEMIGYQTAEITGQSMSDFVYKEDIPDHRRRIKNRFQGRTEHYERRLRHKNGQTVWTQVSATPIVNEEQNFKGSFEMITDITERKKAEEAIRKLNQELEERVADRTAQLESANKELEAFAYSVSHDLRAPLRGIDGFSQILLEEYQDRMDEQGKDYLNRVRSAAQHMAQLIDNLLGLSRISRSDMAIGQVDLSRMVREIADDLHKTDPGRRVSFVIQEGIKVQGDVLLLGIVLKNLLQNAWKFTSKHPRAQIEFGMQQQKGTPVYFIRDDGAGFDMKYADKLFGAFQRLHTAKEFPGTGVGLATVQRIIHRHGGRIWAKGEVEKGAVFHFII